MLLNAVARPVGCAYARGSTSAIEGRQLCWAVPSLRTQTKSGRQASRCNLPPRTLSGLHTPLLCRFPGAELLSIPGGG